MRRPADLVEHLVALGHERLDESLALLRDDVEMIPSPERDPLRGRDEIRAYVADQLRRLGSEVPETVPAMLFEQGDVVLLYAQLRTRRRRRDREFTDVQPIAWVYEIRDGLVARVREFNDWETARKAAGIPASSAPTRTLRTGLHPAVARPQWRPAFA
jgi:ketosteroid isomerase-like protein